MTTTMKDLKNGRTFVFSEALPGRDAYEEALALGFEGTRAEWIASLRGLDFNPASPTWEEDRSYPPRAAVIHQNSFWFARLTNQTVEPGSDEAVWMKLVHGEDATTLANAIETLTALRDAAEKFANAPEDEELPGGGFSANHHRLKSDAARAQTLTIKAEAEAALDQRLVQGADIIGQALAASPTLSPVCALHDLAFAIPPGWWDTQHRLSAVTSLLSTTSAFAIICNWSPVILFAGGRDGAIWDISETGTGVTWGGNVATITDLSPNDRAIAQPNVSQQGRLGRAPIGAAPSATLDGGSGPAFVRLDLFDDVYPTPLAGGTYDVLVAGRGGCWIERDVVIAPGGNLNIGPGTIAGRRAGILSALGGNSGVWADIVGVVPIDRTIGPDELARLVGHARARGAKGLLVPGPELIVNGTFDTNTDGWGSNNSTLAVVDGQLEVTSTGNNGDARKVIPATLGAFYIFTADLISGSVRIMLSDGGINNNTLVSTILDDAQTFLALVRPVLGSEIGLRLRNNTIGATAVWDNVSLRRLIPQEEL